MRAQHIPGFKANSVFVGNDWLLCNWVEGVKITQAGRRVTQNPRKGDKKSAFKWVIRGLWRCWLVA